MWLRIQIVERAFDQNDWFVLIAIVLLAVIVWRLPAKLPRSTTVLLMLLSVAVASVFDNSFGFPPFDFYDIMDGPKYTLMDVVVYLLYAPFAYLFIYLYVRTGVNGVGTIVYILLFSLFAVGFEWLSALFDVFHYKHGYRLVYSFVIYVFVQSVTLFFYRAIR